MHHPQDSVRALTLAIRGLSVGERVTMANGVVVKSVVMTHGSGHERRFAVIPPGGSPRLAANNAHRTATEAAQNALTLGVL